MPTSTSASIMAKMLLDLLSGTCRASLALGQRARISGAGLRNGRAVRSGARARRWGRGGVEAEVAGCIAPGLEVDDALHDGLAWRWREVVRLGQRLVARVSAFVPVGRVTNERRHDHLGVGRKNS